MCMYVYMYMHMYKYVCVFQAYTNVDVHLVIHTNNNIISGMIIITIVSS